MTSVSSDFSGRDDDADGVVALMVTGAIGAAVVPFPVGWPMFIAALCGGVVKIGAIYDITLDKDEAWKLVLQLFKAAGLMWLGLTVGSKFIAAILQATGAGYAVGAALDAAVSGALAYAVGKSSQAYFKGERDKAALGRKFREAFEAKKNNPES
ncbi:DUF697 domain-containing protein [Brevundimonas sp. EAKA]|uniref:DUF697 domain-containing protein n=1 Tax=Brevundimonas sp. EAKA TaxID=1495854 RepID=UPI0018CC2AD1|nr:DUF697 domain-containing protein [Brevundimonas sp. EAKA]